MKCVICNSDPETIYTAPILLIDGGSPNFFCWDDLVRMGLWCKTHGITHTLSNMHGTTCALCVEEATNQADECVLWREIVVRIP